MEPSSFIVLNLKDASYSSHNGSSGTTTSTSSSLLYSTPGTSTMPAVSTSSSSALFGTSAGTSSHLQRLTTSSSLSAGLTGSSSLLLPPVSPLSLPALPLDALNSVGKITHHLFPRKNLLKIDPAIVPLHSFRHPEPESQADMLEIPGKGRCYVYLAK